MPNTADAALTFPLDHTRALRGRTRARCCRSGPTAGRGPRSPPRLLHTHISCLAYRYSWQLLLHFLYIATCALPHAAMPPATQR